MRQVEAGLTRQNVADALGVSHQAVHKKYDEPSGFVTAVLHSLDTAPEIIGELLTQAVTLPASTPTAPSDDPLHRSPTAFVPATPDATWALISDPRRHAEWDAVTESVTAGGWAAGVEASGDARRIVRQRGATRPSIPERTGRRAAAPSPPRLSNAKKETTPADLTVQRSAQRGSRICVS
ncbi:translation elongation factors [Microbacterium testaceum StLB037]|uniref:Translation elongation factors n=1 Tax=Microbacterium testaceum (strain StLB037) TaxID=979556 RepID=E8N9X7_MICTS|nr:SRPBCC family protein [Microbacterium testaceum]BAJ75807.1 translation elongation factors [Microbacterium testaceum StLB037]